MNLGITKQDCEKDFNLNQVEKKKRKKEGNGMKGMNDFFIMIVSVERDTQDGS